MTPRGRQGDKRASACLAVGSAPLFLHDVYQELVGTFACVPPFLCMECLSWKAVLAFYIGPGPPSTEGQQPKTPWVHVPLALSKSFTHASFQWLGYGEMLPKDHKALETFSFLNKWSSKECQLGLCCQAGNDWSVSSGGNGTASEFHHSTVLIRVSSHGLWLIGDAGVGLLRSRRLDCLSPGSLQKFLAERN